MQGIKAYNAILAGNLKHLSDNTEVASDGLWCEWAYFVDFDEGNLETWKGSLKTWEEFQLKGSEDNPFGQSRNDSGFAPIALIDSVAFEKLDEHYMQDLQDKLDEDVDTEDVGFDPAMEGQEAVGDEPGEIDGEMVTEQ